MKFLVVFACALAAASAGNIVAPLLYGAQHLPVIGANGVPVDTAEVQIARAQHLAHKVEAHARNGDWALTAAPLAAAPWATPLLASPWAAAPAVASTWAARQALLTSSVLPVSLNGVPQETPEVQAARLNHYAAHVEANARNGAILLRKRRGLIASAPIATPLVASAWSGSPLVASTWAASPVLASNWAAPQAYPTTAVLPSSVNGVPQETPEVQTARLNHYAAHAEVNARNGNWAIAAPILAAGSPVISAYSAPAWASTIATQW